MSRSSWWTEARFGLFIHWGLYALPARKPAVEIPVVELFLK